MAEKRDLVETVVMPVGDEAHPAQQSPDPEKHNDGARRDYAGAQVKTDPEEIRLVRKLDIRIMVSLHPPSPPPQTRTLRAN